MKTKKYDYLIVGSGLFGSTCAYELKRRGFSVLVLEKRNHVGGNIYTKNIEGINVHVYGPHIFHTDKKEIWEYINRFASFNSFINSPLADYHGERYNLPFNMNTFCQLWKDVKNAEDAKRHIDEEKAKYNISNPSNLEEQAISLVGETIYRKLIKEYTEKQWGRDCSELPATIIKRLPVRFTFNNNYFDDPYQGIPQGGYTQIIEKMLYGIDVVLNEDFLLKKDYYLSTCKRVIYTGPIDEYFNYKFGKLEYRSLDFEIRILDTSVYQGNAVINYTSHEVPYTRVIEHKFFEDSVSKKTIISFEYPSKYFDGKIPYYAINDDRNNELYGTYLKEAKKSGNVFFGGRLGSYRYFDMDDTIYSALELIRGLCNE